LKERVLSKSHELNIDLSLQNMEAYRKNKRWFFRHGQYLVDMEIIDEIVRRFSNPIKPVLVKTGPCKENILKGNEVDLLKLPVPFFRSFDGGRYIGTWHTDITKDPDSGWTNWGMYRNMLHDSR
jgi:UbiD family decarboxylase